MMVKLRLHLFKYINIDLGGYGFFKKEFLIVNSVPYNFSFINIIARWDNGNIIKLINKRPPEGDRRDMPLAHCSETDDHAPFAVFQFSLIGIFDNRRVKKCSRLYRVFMCKI